MLNLCYIFHMIYSMIILLSLSSEIIYIYIVSCIMKVFEETQERGFCIQRSTLKKGGHCYGRPYTHLLRKILKNILFSYVASRILTLRRINNSLAALFS